MFQFCFQKVPVDPPTRRIELLLDPRFWRGLRSENWNPKTTQKCEQKNVFTFSKTNHGPAFGRTVSPKRYYFLFKWTFRTFFDNFLPPRKRRNVTISCPNELFERFWSLFTTQKAPKRYYFLSKLNFSNDFWPLFTTQKAPKRYYFLSKWTFRAFLITFYHSESAETLLFLANMNYSMIFWSSKMDFSKIEK